MKRCPYCAEEIQDAAIVCRFCQRDLPASPYERQLATGVTVDASGALHSTGAATVTPRRTCPYCKEAVQEGATICPRCTKDIGPGHALKHAGEKMQAVGCALTLLITVPMIVFALMMSC